MIMSGKEKISKVNFFSKGCNKLGVQHDAKKVASPNHIL